MKKNVFMMFALLLAMGGAWAQSTPEPGTLVPTGNANEWTLTIPADNMLLMVSYYDEYTLDSIPTTWQVLVNGVAQTVIPYTEGNTTLGHLTISETDSVELIPPADVKPNVKNVTLTEVVAAPAVPEYYNKLTKINDDFWEQINVLKRLGRGYQAYNSSLTAAQAYALATYQAAIDGQAVYVIMSSQSNGYEIHYAVSTDAAATEHTADLYAICDEDSPAVRMYYVAQ